MRAPRVRPDAEIRATEEARRVVAEHRITRPGQIDLAAIAAARGAEILYRELDGATARVVQVGSLARITISTRIIDLGGRRFSIAHELGHLCLGHMIADGVDVERICTPLVACRREPERAASVFASEIVMPEPLVRPRCIVPSATLVPARTIAEEFTTSLLASAMRFVELTDHSCAIAYARLGRVRWIKPSVSFPHWIPEGARLDPASAAFDYHRTGVIDTAPRVLASDAWLPQGRVDGTNIEVVEQSAAIPELGATFTMLWIPDRDLRHLDLVA